MTSDYLLFYIVILAVIAFIAFLFYLLREYYRSLIEKMVYQTAKMVEKIDQLEERIKGGKGNERRYKETRELPGKKDR